MIVLILLMSLSTKLLSGMLWVGIHIDESAMGKLSLVFNNFLSSSWKKRSIDAYPFSLNNAICSSVILALIDSIKIFKLQLEETHVLWNLVKWRSTGIYVSGLLD